MATTFEPANWAEAKWEQLYASGYDPIWVTTAISFVLHEVVYFGRFLPWWLCDFVPALRQYKIQKQKDNTRELLWKCFRMLMFSHIVIQLPMQMLFHPTAEFFGMKIHGVHFPGIAAIAGQILLFMVFEDTYHYWFHRMLHYGPFYRYIHKQHHEFTAPFGITAEYAHPLETLILGIGTIGGPWLYVYATGDLHIITVFLWLIVRLFQTVDAHSGYDLPISLRRFLPFWAGADYHDYHHAVFLGNYSSTFRWWDWICGTDWRYVQYKQKLAQQEAQQSRNKGAHKLRSAPKEE